MKGRPESGASNGYTAACSRIRYPELKGTKQRSPGAGQRHGIEAEEGYGGARWIVHGDLHIKSPWSKPRQANGGYLSHQACL